MGIIVKKRRVNGKLVTFRIHTSRDARRLKEEQESEKLLKFLAKKRGVKLNGKKLKKLNGKKKKDLIKSLVGKGELPSAKEQVKSLLSPFASLVKKKRRR